MTVIAVLTAAETDLLTEAEATIERGMKTFVEVGEALLSVRENRLYRAQHATFEAYCQQRWGFSDSRARQLIGAAQTVTNVTVAGLPAPTNEGQARALTQVPEEQRADVWRDTLDRTDGKPTAAAVAATWQERQQPEPDPEPDDIDDVPLWDDEPTAEPEPVRPAPPTSPGPAWSADETERRKRLEAGETVVISLRGNHTNLYRWADSSGLVERIDRRSDWGNPFEMPGDGNRATVIAAYADHYLPHKPSLLNRIGELRGKALACWCAPEPCHGDILAGRAEQC